MGRRCMCLSKTTFSKLIGETWMESLTHNNIISGFESTGIYPVDRTKFPTDEFNPIDLQTYQQRSLEAPETVSTVNNQDSPVQLDPDSNPNNSEPVVSMNESNVEVDSTNILSSMNQESQQKGAPNFIEDKATKQPSLADLFDIGTSSCIKAKSSEFPLQEKKPIPRLKQMTYGEVLTTNEVLNRLKDAEAKKEAKKRKRPEKAKTSKKAKISKGEKKTLKNKNDSITSSDATENEISYKNDEDSPWDEDENELEEEELQCVGSKTLEKGCFILARFKGGKRNSTIFKYVCVVESYHSNDDIEVTGLKSLDTAKVNFVMVPADKCTISLTDIIGILPPPILEVVGKHTHYKFNKKVDVKEK